MRIRAGRAWRQSSSLNMSIKCAGPRSPKAPRLHRKALPANAALAPHATARAASTPDRTPLSAMSRLSADLLRDRRQDVDRRRQGVDLAPAVVGDMETVDAERNGAFGVCGMKHAIQQ